MKAKVVLIAFVLTLTGFLVQGQDLGRKAMFGVAVGPLTDAGVEIKEKEGVYIRDVIPGFTFEKLGISKGGVLLEINGIKTINLDTFREATSRVRAGEQVNVVISENDKVKIYKGIAVARPLEQHPEADVHYGVVSYPGNKLRSILYTPKGKEDPPVVFYLQGYTCQSVEYPSFTPMKKLIDDWISAGFAVYMVEKPGMGDSQSTVNCREINFHQELEGFTHAYKALFEEERIDKENVFLFGHSLGGVVAPILADQIKPKGVMVYGTVGKNWFDYMKDVVTEQQMLFGSTREAVDKMSAQSFPFLEDLMLNKKSNTEMVRTQDYQEYLEQEGVLEELEQGYYLGRHYTFWQSLAEIDIPGAWARVEGPVYVMHGEFDVQAVNAKYARMIVTNVNQHKGKADFDLVPGVDHVLVAFDSMEENIRALTNGSYRQLMRTAYNPVVARYSISWMKGLSEG